MSAKKKAGIIGGAGYTAGELIRLLQHHDEVELTYVQSTSNAGKSLAMVHQDLFGETDLVFSENAGEADVLFLCRGHGQSKAFLQDHPLNGETVIDLSHDFRLKRDDHDFTYGLPEVYGQTIRQSKKIANPGCFATCIQLALVPLAFAQQLNAPTHVTAVTGSTGAGQQPSVTTHYSWRNNNISVYKAFQHQHLGEIKQTLSHLQPNANQEINFLPFRGNFTRGIYATCYLDIDISLSASRQLYQDYYAEHPFVKVVDHEPSLKMVVNTNKCYLYLMRVDNKLLIISMIDNLLKGASGQAVQNMNLAFGLDQTAGLQLKASFF